MPYLKILYSLPKEKKEISVSVSYTEPANTILNKPLKKKGRSDAV